MENSNRDDVYQFFKDMPQEMQIEAINKMQRQPKKPPDSNPYQKSLDVMSEDIEEFEERKWSNISELSVK